MPKYPPNLCTLSPKEQAAIEADKRLWYRAHRIRRDIAEGRRTRGGVRRWLDTLPAEEAAELRRRLNAMDAKATAGVNPLDKKGGAAGR